MGIVRKLAAVYQWPNRSLGCVHVGVFTRLLYQRNFHRPASRFQVDGVTKGTAFVSILSTKGDSLRAVLSRSPHNVMLNYLKNNPITNGVQPRRSCAEASPSTSTVTGPRPASAPMLVRSRKLVGTFQYHLT